MPIQPDKPLSMSLSAPKDSLLMLWFAWIIFAACICALLTAEDLRLMQNSDVYYLPVMALDLMKWGGHIGEWAMPPAPYIFPDMVVYFPLFWLTGNSHVSLLLCGVLNYVLFVLGWVLLCRRIAVSPEGRFLGQVTIILLAAAVVTMEPFRDMALMSMQISIHFGVMVAIPYALLVADNCAKAGSRRVLTARCGVLFILVLLLGLSDPLSVTQVALPLVASGIFLFMLAQAEWWRIVVATCVLLAGTVSGVLILRRLENPAVYLYVQTAVPLAGSSAGAFIEWANEWFINNRPEFVFCCSAFLIQVAVVCVAVRRMALQRPLPAQSVLVSSFALFAVVINVTAVVVTGNFYSGNAVRYVMSILFVPMFALAVLAGMIKTAENIMYWVRLIIVVLLCALFATNAGYLYRAAELKRYADFYPEWVRWLDRESAARNLHCGISTYWDAKYIDLLSRNSIKMLQSNADFSPYNWISNTAWYDRLIPDFILCTSDPADNNRLPVDSVVQQFGRPSDSFASNNLVVLVYRGDSASGFRNRLKDHPLRVDFRKPGARAVFYPGDLGSQTGVMSNGFRTAIAGRDTAGYLTTGPFAHVPRGDYLATIHYESQAGADGCKPAGLWDVSVKKRDAVQTIRSGRLDAGNKLIKVSFALDRSSVIAVQAHFEGAGTLSVEKIELERKL